MPPPTCATACRACAAGCRSAIDEPVIAKVEADATPTIWLAFTSETLSPLEVTDLVNRIVRPRLQTVPGVAEVQHQRRPRLLDAHLGRSGSARRLSAHRAGRRGRAAAPEPRGAGWPHREPAARVQRHRAHRPEHRRAIPRGGGQERLRLSGQAVGRGAHRRGAAQRALERAAERRAVGVDRHDPHRPPRTRSRSRPACAR